LFSQLVSKIFNLCGHDPATPQTDGRADGQTTCNRKTVLCTIVHRVVKTIFNKHLGAGASKTYLNVLWTN